MTLTDDLAEKQMFKNDLLMPMFQTLALFLIVMGARFAIVFKYGTDLPYWDQWGAEGQELIKRYYDGTLGIKHWFAAHNEHRCFFARVIALTVTLLNAQWDARVEMLINAVICAIGASWLYYYTLGGLKNAIQRWAWSVVLAVVFTFPFGWENTIAGFHSSWYLLAIFSVVSIALLGYYPTFSWQWQAGCVLLFSALFTMASGLMASILVIVVLLVILVRERNDWRGTLKSTIPTYLICTVTAITGLLLTVKVAVHAKYQAQSIGQLFEAFTACFAWPYMGHSWWGLINWLPFVVFFVAFVSRFTGTSRTDRLAVGMGLWVILQSFAMSYSRAGIVYSSRYFDVFGYGLIVNFLCILLLFQSIRRLSLKYAVILFALLWLVVNGTNLYSVSFNGALYQRKFFYDLQVANTGAYLATNDFNFLVPKRDKKEIPFPDIEDFSTWIKAPIINSVLPASVRNTIKIKPVGIGLSRGVNNLGILESPLHPGQPAWIAFANPEGSSFEAVANKSAKLPFIRFFLSGDIDKIVVKDRNNRSHRVHKLPFGGFIGNLGVWQPVYAYCPGTEFRISGVTSAKTPVSFSEPTEMGRLSLWGLYTASAGVKVFWIGMFLSCIALIWEIFMFRKIMKSRI